MKKVIIILMILCIMLCGCSKAANEPASTTSTTNTPTEVEKAEITPTKEPTPIEMPCDICHKTGMCKPYECKRLDFEKYTYSSTNYYVCENCWNEIMDVEQDRVTYETLISAAYNIMSDPKAQLYYKDQNLCISLAPNGILILPDDWLENKLKELLGENCMTEMKSLNKDENHNIYMFTMKNTGETQRDFPPKSVFFPDDKTYYEAYKEMLDSMTTEELLDYLENENKNKK